MKQKIIIVEGVDRTGKTSLCQTLEGRLGIKIYSRPSDGFDFTRLVNGGVAKEMMQLLTHLHRTQQSIIFDRLHLSEFVYGKFNRNYEEWENARYFNCMEEFMTGFDVTLIYHAPSDIKWSSKMHGQDLTPYDLEFRRLFELSRIPKKYISTFNTHLEDVPKIEALIKEDITL